MMERRARKGSWQCSSTCRTRSGFEGGKTSAKAAEAARGRNQITKERHASVGQKKEARQMKHWKGAQSKENSLQDDGDG